MGADIQRPARLAALIAKLDASSTDAERLAVLGRVDREMGRAGLGWPDLAERLVALQAPSDSPVGNRTFSDFRQAARWLWNAAPDRLSAREREFVAQMELWRGAPSEKQIAWLQALVARHGGDLRT